MRGQTQRPPYSRLDLLEALQRAAVVLGRSPTSEDCSTDALPTAYQTFLRQFPGWGAALDAAGLPPPPPREAL